MKYIVIPVGVNVLDPVQVKSQETMSYGLFLELRDEVEETL